MVAYGKGNNQYSIRKKIYEKIRVIGNIKAMWIVFSQKQNYKKKEKLMIPKISSYSKHSKHKLLKNQKSNYNDDKK